MYGFVVDSEKPVWKNIPNALKAINVTTYLQTPTNLLCHNLCKKLQPPTGFDQLLGLGLNYCIKECHPKPNIKHTIEKLTRSIRLQVWINEEGPPGNDNDYIPTLYIPSPWKPPPASNEIENNLQLFTSRVKNLIRNNTTTKKSNLTKLQYTCLKKIKNNKRFIVCLSDKNLGPVIMERASYFKHCLEDHLYCRTTYRQLTEEKATEMVSHIRHTLTQIRLNHRKDLSDSENTYFQRNGKLDHRLPQFYITIIIHKKPYKTRPIVSCVGSFLNPFSKCIDHHLQKMVFFSPTYVKDSNRILQELKALTNLPPHSMLFTCDANSMYTNINSIHGPELISKWIEEFLEDLQETLPKDLLLKVLIINVFQFEDTYWLQTCGTSMGTSCGCSYATLYWAYIERKYIIPKWKNQLYFLRRFIDDKFGIWIGTKEEFGSFIQDINSYSQLKWTSDGLQKEVNFLDLTISINNHHQIVTKTYQKPTNLHLYIPPTSAHPPSVLKSLIYGNLYRYWKQNTYIADFVDIAKQFASRLVNRGYKIDDIKHIFLSAAKKLDKIIEKRNTGNTSTNTLYLHWRYHPRDIPKAKLRLLYNETLKDCSGFNNLIICYSRPRNLRDSLMQTKLNEPDGMRISNLLQEKENGIRRGI
jgi:hypothetical protein